MYTSSQELSERNISPLQALLREPPRWLISSEYDWREERRLGNPSLDEYMAAIGRLYGEPHIFFNHAPWALPGRDYVPHDYMYTNPETRVYPLAGK